MCMFWGVQRDSSIDCIRGCCQPQAQELVGAHVVSLFSLLNRGQASPEVFLAQPACPLFGDAALA